MSLYYIEAVVQDQVVIYHLDATTRVKLSLPSKVTSNRLESGDEVVDHIINLPAKVSFSGVISDVKSLSNKNNLNAEDYINGLMKIRQRKQTFSLILPDGKIRLDGCAFESLDIDQDNKHGSVTTPNGGINSSFNISFSAKQIRIASAAYNTILPEQAVSDQNTDEENSSDNTKDMSESDKLRAEIAAREALGKAQVKAAVEG